MRIGFVHTATLLVDRCKADMAAEQPHADTFHVLNEGLLQDLARGEDRSAVYRRTVQQLLMVADMAPNLIVMTCNNTAPAVDLARQICPIPIIKIDDPMAAEAVRIGRRIAILCTNTNTPGPSASLMRQHASVQGREVLVETVVRPEASTALFAGDRARHDSIMLEAAREAVVRADVLVLAQVSLAHLHDQMSDWGKPVLISPPLLMADLARRLAPRRSNV